MRHIEIADGLRLRFPGRTEEFDQGVEIGVIAVLMDFGTREFTRSISRASLVQARALAEKMGYRLLEGAGDRTFVEVTLRTGQARPQLKLVSSQG
jgi:hypothetical protein